MTPPVPPDELSQWDCIRQNVGEWQGSFTQFSPTGERVKDTPSRLTLVEDRPDQHMTLTLERTPPGGRPHTVVQEFGPPGPAPYVVFFGSGAFSQGPLQRRGWSDFGAELALNTGDRRLRTVQMYDSDVAGHSVLHYVTLIREGRAGGQTPERPLACWADVTGDWTGQAIFQASNMDAPVVAQSRHSLSNAGSSHSEIVVPTGQTLLSDTQTFTQRTDQRLSNDHWQMLLLPDGAVCTVPHRLLANQGFTLELAWLLAPNHRQRLIRQYDDQGNWLGLFWMTESRT
ncbi:MAG: DUF3598 family protein [Cyanobacteria bacterium P01_A01_bin.105]